MRRGPRKPDPRAQHGPCHARHAPLDPPPTHTPTVCPPGSAKVAAEWQAWALAAQQDRWRLVTICPGNVYGPLLANSPNCGEHRARPG